MLLAIEKTMRETPELLPAIERGVRASYTRLCSMYTVSRWREPLYSSHFMQALYPVLNDTVKEEVELLGLPHIEVAIRKNAGKQYNHVEIETPHAVIIVSSVEQREGFPREAVYRKNLASNQVYFPIAFPDFVEREKNQKANIVVTHYRRRGQYEPESLYVGAPNIDGTAWAFNMPMPIAAQEEVSINNDPKYKKEEIIRTGTVHFKR